MRKLVCLAATALLAACAQPPLAPTHMPQQPSPQNADARTRADIHTRLGAGYYELRNFSVALEELNEALKAEPGYGPAHNMLGLVYMELRENALAEQSFERALGANGMDSDAHNNYGWFLCQQKRHEEGIKHFMAAIKNPLYDTPEKSYVNAGVCARQRGDDATALQYFERAVSIQPAQSQALYQLADMAFRRGQVPDAKTYLARLGKTGSAFGAEALWLGLRIERRLGDREAEANYGLQLRKNFPDSRETQALLNRQYE